MKLTKGEIHNLEFHYGRQDVNSFWGIQMRAMYKADSENLSMLMKAFPEEAESVLRWRTENGYARRIEKEYKEFLGLE